MKEESQEQYNQSVIFNNIFAVFDYLSKKGWAINMYTPPYFEAMKLYGKRYAYVPMPMQPLYRGQNAFYEPCYPSLYRKDLTPLEKYERELQFQDFIIILNDNPEIKNTINANMEVYYKGLAQHYGIETNVLDLTNSALVAAFFATTDYNEKTNLYYPIMETIRKGVLYFFPLGVFNYGGHGNIWPIGMESLKRPGEQRGFSIELKERENMNNMGCNKFFFWQNPRISIRIFEMCQYGRMFFPYDPMTEKIKMMKTLNFYSISALNFVTQKYHLNNDNLQKKLENAGCKFFDKTPFLYTSKEKEYLDLEYKRKFPNM